MASPEPAGITVPRGAVALLLVAFGFLYATTLSSNRMFRWDEAEYASIGRSITRGEGFAISGVPNALRPPLLPLAVAGAIVIGGNTDDAAVMRPMLVFALLALGVTYFGAAVAYGRMTGMAAATLLGVSPAFWTSTPALMTEIPFMAFFTAAVVGFYLGLYRDPRYFYAGWLCWAAALMTRHTGVLLVPIVAIFAMLALASRDTEALRRLRSRHALLAAGAGVLVVLPWFIRQQLTFGDAFAGLRQASQQLPLFSTDLSMPFYFYPWHLSDWLSPAVTVLLVAGAARLLWRGDRFARHAVVASAVIVVWMSCYRFKEMRQVSAVFPLLAILAAAGLREALFASKLTRASLTLAVVLLAGITAVEFRATRPIFRDRVPLGYPSFLRAMQFVRAHSSPDDVVVGANYPQIHWYADRLAIDLPERAQMGETLGRSAWVVVTDFERGQKTYGGEILRALSDGAWRGDEGAVFPDGQFVTGVVRSTALLQRWR
jgi:4-amino-4-deoxy-L-arabinose transferase-like glycosyltransferase